MPEEQVPFPGSGDRGAPLQPPGPMVPGGPGLPWPAAPPLAGPGATSPFTHPGTPPAGAGGSPWPAAGAWPALAPPPRRRARAVLLGAFAALLSALVAGTAGYLIGVQHSRIAAAVRSYGAGFQAAASGPCPAGITVPDPSATSAAGAALLAQVLPRPPRATRVSALRQGVLSLRGYVSELYPGNSSEQQRLTFRCFQTAVHATWQSPSGTVTSVWLIQFGTAADARSYTLSTEQGDRADPANSDQFQVPRVHDGLGLGRPALDKYGNTLTRLLGDAGNTSIIIHIFRPAGTDNKAAARVLQAQNARLTAPSA